MLQVPILPKSPHMWPLYAACGIEVIQNCMAPEASSQMMLALHPRPKN